jgi:hypothetical protein
MKWSDLVGTVVSYFKIGIGGVRLKNSSGNLLIRNTGDSGDAEITASKVNVSGNDLVLNSDAAGSGADYKITLTRPSSGMSADVTLTLPATDGSANQVLQTDGDGVLSWASAGSTSACITADTTSVAFGSSSPVTAFTLPANAVVDRVVVKVDTAFNGTAPTISVGVSGTTSKYMPATANDLTATGEYEYHPNLTADGSTNDIIVTYSADSSSAGAARVEVHYSIPA